MKTNYHTEMKEQIKTHWLQSPNKNYLGHWDLPEKGDMILTIESAKWEEVINPIINKSEAKRVVRFKEKVKPFICNQINANSILKATGCKYMEDSGGKKISLFITNIIDKRTKEDIDCIRIRTNKIVDKPELKVETKEFQNVVKAMKNGYTIEDIKGKYTVSQETEIAILEL
ncbi:MAG: hypothetical protein IID16_00795 [Candidatus Marinimicrobia bacterium]|nr:hypothetical protein [Candidatus Neomarinimicrobiota bacterium]